jgi:hypothetical protein
LIRATTTDGDANSIREALSFQVPVIASDVVERPAGSVVFENRSLDDLVRAVGEVLTDPPHISDAERASLEERTIRYLDMLASWCAQPRRPVTQD